MHEQHLLVAEEIARDYLQTVNANIRLFLKDKSRKMAVSLETVKSDFANFWDSINAQGDLEAALREWDTQYNASE
jgi:hypothetical protein